MPPALPGEQSPRLCFVHHPAADDRDQDPALEQPSRIGFADAVLVDEVAEEGKGLLEIQGHAGIEAAQAAELSATMDDRRPAVPCTQELGA